MELLLVAARLLLAAVFLVSGLGKLLDRKGTRRAVIDFGTPVRLASPVALVLPVSELAVAAALLPEASARWGVLGAISLLAVFSVGIAINIAKGRRPDCHCFGQFHSAPIGWGTLVRNGLLAAVAGFVLWHGWDDPGSATRWVDGMTAGAWVAVAGATLGLLMLAILGWLVMNLLRQQGRVLARLDAVEAALQLEGLIEEPSTTPADGSGGSRGLPIGRPAPAFSLPALNGVKMTLDALREARKPVLLLFTDPHCGPCDALLPDVARWQAQHADRLTLPLISRGSREENRIKAEQHGLTEVFLQNDREVGLAFEAPGTPSAVLVNADGTIGSPVAEGAQSIRALVTRTIAGTSEGPPRPPFGGQALPPEEREPARPPVLGIGEAAPPTRLPDLEGRMVDLAGFRGSRTLVLFWNPRCGFCQRMLDDLKAWEKRPAKGAPRLLVISTGGVKENRAMGIRSPVVLDDAFNVGNSFGARGTPMAVVVDEEGRIASELAAGATAVLALARGSTARSASTV